MSKKDQHVLCTSMYNTIIFFPHQTTFELVFLTNSVVIGEDSVQTFAALFRDFYCIYFFLKLS